MEVLLESLEGTALEEGSLISVRCGNERRQARLKPGQTFRFPQAAKAGPMGHALKVEALQCLGERIFYLDATEGSKLGRGRSPTRDRSRDHFCSSQVRHHREMTANFAARF